MRVFTLFSGYDFGYFLKLLTGDSIPTSEDQFFDLIYIWFPNVYDLKFMMRSCKGLKGGLAELAEDLGVRASLMLPSLQLTPTQVMRIGNSHQAGSDSLLTMATFFKMRELYFDDRIEHEEYNGKLYGLGQTFAVASTGTGATTMAERDDRQVASATPQSQMSLPTPAIGGALPSALPQGAGYGPMGANTQFIRTTIGVGGR